jgi:cyclic beta-1,2-glucan synthetase
MYRAWTEEVLGLKVRGNQLWIDPVIPAAWPGYSLRYRHGQTIYEIQVENPHHCERGVDWVEMDGRRLGGKVILLERELVKHRVVVRMGMQPVDAEGGEATKSPMSSLASSSWPAGKNGS